MSARVPLSARRLLRPTSLADALHMLRDEGPLTPIAGCTDVYVALHFGTMDTRRFIDVWSLPELRGIAVRGQTLSLGALTTFHELRASAVVRRWLPMLVAAAGEVGGLQIQNRATVGGNLANASPAADSLPVFAAANASVVLRSVDDERRVPLTAFYTGYRTTVRRPDELIVAVEVPRVRGRQYWRKVGTRRAQAISKVMCAAVRGADVRVAFGSVAEVVLRVPRTEAVLTAGGTLQDAQHTLRTEIRPIDDLRSTAAYRLEVSANLLADFWGRTESRQQ